MFSMTITKERFKEMVNKKNIDIDDLLEDVMGDRRPKRNTPGFVRDVKKQQELRARLRKERALLLSAAEGAKIDEENSPSQDDRWINESLKDTYESKARLHLWALQKGAPACKSRKNEAEELKKALKERDKTNPHLPLKKYLKQKEKTLKKILERAQIKTSSRKNKEKE